ncbi:AraC family transcriptional regulator [Pedobacter sp.]|uniref:helix-turn-helix domain-containing protein n=1 Tax=Pedobacter sp. TaxID=1411316 RepID=UPI0031CF8307
MTSYENLATQKEKEITLNLGLCTEAHDTETLSLLKKLRFSKFLFRKFTAEEIGDNPISIVTNQNILLIQYCLQGSCSLKNSSSKKAEFFKQAEYNIILLPKDETTVITNDGDYDLMHIYLSEAFFYQYMPQDYSTPLYNLKDIGKLFHKNLYLSPKLKYILNEINLCDFGDHLKNLYTKAKIIELLSLQLAQHEEEKLIPATLKPLEVEKMILVKELIENNITESHTISSLARAVGTNEQYLKKHFKLLFGSTVFGHMISCKMEKAKEMLLTGQYRITEIAEKVGYKHATHFTNAFKKFFGCLPQSFKTKLFFGYFSFGFELEALEILMMV